MAKAQKHIMECDDCIFCLCKCSQCGSTDVSVMARIELGLTNELPDEIQISCSWGFNDAFIECHRCGADEDSPELGDAVARMCKIPDRITINDKGECTLQFTTVIIVDEE